MSRVFVTASCTTGKGIVLDAETGQMYVHKQAGVIPINLPPVRRKKRKATAKRKPKQATRAVPVTKAARMSMPGLGDVPDPSDEIPPMRYRTVKPKWKIVKSNGARRLEMPRVPTE